MQSVSISHHSMSCSSFCDFRRNALGCLRSSIAAFLCRPCLSAFWFPLGAHDPGAALSGDRALKLETLQAEIDKLKVFAAGHRADFEREWERSDRMMTELLRATYEAMMAKEEAAHLKSEAALRAWPWWRRLAG